MWLGGRARKGAPAHSNATPAGSVAVHSAWSVVVGVAFASAALAAGVDDVATPAPATVPSSNAQPAMTNAPLFLSAPLPNCLFESLDLSRPGMWSSRATLLSEVFRLVQLIADDFLDALSPCVELSHERPEVRCFQDFS